MIIRKFSSGSIESTPSFLSRSFRTSMPDRADVSIVSMLKAVTFGIEGEDPKFWVFRCERERLREREREKL